MSDLRMPFVGVGTGRCGTTSLQKLVQACKNVRCSHERYQLHWYKVNKELGRMIKEFRELGKRGVMGGDVCSGNVKHIANIRSSFMGMRVVCLRRDKEETVRSFMNYAFNHVLRPGDKRGYIEATGDLDSIQAKASGCFPLIDAYNPEQAYGFYWEMYQKLMDAVPEPVFNIRTHDLSDDDKIVELFDFLEIPEKDRRFLEKRKFWSNEEIQPIKEAMNRARYV